MTIDMAKTAGRLLDKRKLFNDVHDRALTISQKARMNDNQDITVLRKYIDELANLAMESSLEVVKLIESEIEALK